ncbi:phosphotransferase [Rhizobium beringeri]
MIGYSKAASLSRKALAENRALRDVVEEDGVLGPTDLDRVFDGAAVFAQATPSPQSYKEVAMGVFTELSDADRILIASAYGMKGLTSVIGIANGNTETTYLFRTAEGEFIVTLFENGAEPLDLEQAFETMDNLYAHGVPCPEAETDA